MNHGRGFTLIELMIAILIFAMISTAAYRLLDSVSRAERITSGLFDKLDDQQRALTIIEKDLLQLAPRPIRNEFGDSENALQSPGQDDVLIDFTRFGWRNPLNEIRSNLQRVTYNLEDGELARYYWLMLDRAPDPVVIRQVLMNNVLDVRLKFMNEKKRWVSSWPPKNKSSHPHAQEAGKGPEPEAYPKLPYAMELAVRHREYGTLTTVVPLLSYKPPEYLELKDDQQQSGSGMEELEGLEDDDFDFDFGGADYDEL